jgi:protoheme IX farnesyltransferase
MSSAVSIRAVSAMGAYVRLTKPRLLPLVLLSGLPAFWIAAQGPALGASVWLTLVGIALAAGSANALNSYLERDRDALMARTAARPLPAGELAPPQALVFGLVLGALGPALLWVLGGAVPALLALAGIAFYIFVYTLWLKPRSPIAVVVGGVTGAIAPLIASAAVDGSIGAGGLVLFAIIFVWQPPHFWAISLFRQAEYEAAGFPLLPTRRGGPATCRRIVAWIVALLPISALPLVSLGLGPLYGVAAAALGGWFLSSAIRLLRAPSASAARRVFTTSLGYLTGLFVAMICDLALASMM